MFLQNVPNKVDENDRERERELLNLLLLFVTRLLQYIELLALCQKKERNIASRIFAYFINEKKNRTNMNNFIQKFQILM